MLPANLFAQQYLSALRRAVTPEAWPYYLLRGPYAGVAAGVPYAATVDEIWPRALQEFDAWRAKGCPGLMPDPQHIPQPVIPREGAPTS